MKWCFEMQIRGCSRLVIQIVTLGYMLVDLSQHVSGVPLCPEMLSAVHVRIEIALYGFCFPPMHPTAIK